MSILFFIGPIRPEETAYSASGCLLDFRPFRQNSVNEADARKIKEHCTADTYRFGLFDAAPRNQLLYLLSEDLINAVLISRISEPDLRRIAETFHKPIFLEGTCKAPETILREQRLPIAGHFFLAIPEDEVMEILTKPYILSMNAIDRTKDNAARLGEHPPFALWCGTPAEAETAKAWAQTILTK